MLEGGFTLGRRKSSVIASPPNWATLCSWMRCRPPSTSYVLSGGSLCGGSIHCAKPFLQVPAQVRLPPIPKAVRRSPDRTGILPGQDREPGAGPAGESRSCSIAVTSPSCFTVSTGRSRPKPFRFSEGAADGLQRAGRRPHRPLQPRRNPDPTDPLGRDAEGVRPDAGASRRGSQGPSLGVGRVPQRGTGRLSGSSGGTSPNPPILSRGANVAMIPHWAPTGTGQGTGVCSVMTSQTRQRSG